MNEDKKKLHVAVLLCLITLVNGITDPNDFEVLNEFRNGLDNPELLEWPAKGTDPCGPPLWPHVFCSNGRVTQIQVRKLGLKGTLPQNLNRLEKLQNLGFQWNKFRGKLPTFSGLSELQYAYLGSNEFDTIPSDFFHGLANVRVLALDYNPFNASTGWAIPNEIQDSVQLSNFSCAKCNVLGPLPEFFGKFPSLITLGLSYNRLSGEIPASFNDSMLQFLWLNDQDGDGFTGPIDVIGSMVGLTEVWLHGNHFTGTIPDSIGGLTSLRRLKLSRNQLTGQIPLSLANMDLEILNLESNMLMGPIPKFKAATVTYSENSFCQSVPGQQCSPTVNVLLDFLRHLNYPSNLASKWSSNNPCEGPWWGITCNHESQVSVINLQRLKLNGSLSPSLASLGSLVEIHLGGNNVGGQVPMNFTELKSLRLLDLTGNNFQPPLPKFGDGVKVIIDGNSLLVPNETQGLPPPPITNPSPPLNNSSPPLNNSSPPPNNSSPPLNNSSPPPNNSSPPSAGNSSKPIQEQPKSGTFREFKLVIVISVVASVISILLMALLCTRCFKFGKESKGAPSAFVIHPQDPSYPDNMIKIAIAHDVTKGTPPFSVSENASGRVEKAHMIEEGSMVISAKILREVTNNFAPENELGRGGFGVVYKGVLEDGTKLAVKRMESTMISSKALDEFQAEIAALSSVRHRHLVSLYGYSVEGNEKLLVYEYMPQGALSRHLFYWQKFNLEPLSWAKRLIIALDVARGMEYLHNLAHQSFIHRDLKSSNILLSDDFRAKVADFGLVKLAPDRERSVATRLAGTFGYLAPEYAVTGKVTTKSDVFSFGVVLMEILTGLVALDERRSEEHRCLAEWFWQIKSDCEKVISAVDPALNATEEIFDSICSVAELAGHCTVRDPNHRPDMGHAVNVLSQLVEKWKPFDEEKEYSGIDFALPLSQMLKGWKENETKDSSGTSQQDSKGSIPTRPGGFADSFNSSDAR
ncbi:hypothetical protein LguiA_012431 [Lonicera macranthoides]